MVNYYISTYNGKKSKVIDIYESFSGWYWFITEKKGDEWFGLVRGFEDEFGYVDYNELKEQIDRGYVWKVPKKNWFGCPLIERGN